LNGDAQAALAAKEQQYLNGRWRRWSGTIRPRITVSMDSETLESIPILRQAKAACNKLR
jgi:hypothetical protein